MSLKTSEMNIKSLYITLIIVLSTCSHQSYGQENNLSFMYWRNNDQFVRFDSIGRHMEAYLFLGSKEFVFEEYDHNNVKLILGTYDTDCKGNLNVAYDIKRTTEFVNENKKNSSSLVIFANKKHYRYLNWSKEGCKIYYDYQLRDNRPELKEYRLSISDD